MTSVNLENEKKLILEVLEFFEVSHENYGCEEAPPNEQGKAVVQWWAQIDKDTRLTGIYEHRDENYTKTSVTMAIIISRMQYGYAIVDIMEMIGMVAHPKPERNSVLEIVLRYLIFSAINAKKRKSEVQSYVLGKMLFRQNLEDIFEAKKQAEKASVGRDNGDQLIQ